MNQNNVVNSYESAFKIKYRLNKHTKYMLRFCNERDEAESFIRCLLQDENYNYQTVELYNNQTDILIKAYR